MGWGELPDSFRLLQSRTENQKVTGRGIPLRAETLLLMSWLFCTSTSNTAQKSYSV